MNFQLINIELHSDELKKFDPKEQGLSEYRYTGIAIEEGSRFYYWAKGVSIEISDWEYANIKLNPKLYYFSTALKLHLRIDRALGASATNTLA
ncbi:hypothetical protein [Polynucleobacter sp. es-EL-1]|uniref:hypothetical protein n=1 Tax=Polynucleobacter sp. es-EL-1 TaxID=1855652 RepID=UPI001BFEE4F9|nr:hypothetical protein [Polynucleobacter sp. es-EL-1]QWE09850.1 hypothetical protein FD974_05710 [Polynucleobacter sp. es-EL-1]